MGARHEPVVSVVIPVYNHERFVAEAIRSVLSQTYPHIDLVVIDDGSTDGSLQVVQRLADGTGVHRLRAFTQQNRGTALTLNRGATLATGAYLAILGSDDLLTPDSVSLRVRYLREHPAVDLLFGEAVSVNENGEPGALLVDDPEYVERLVSRPLFTLLSELNRIPAPSVMMRRTLVLEMGGFDECPVEDLDLWIRCAARGAKIAFLPKPVVYYRIHGNNALRRDPLRFWGGILDVRERHIRLAEGLSVDEQRQALALCLAARASSALWRHPAVSLAAILKGLVTDPTTFLGELTSLARRRWPLRSRLVRAFFGDQSQRG